MTEAATAGAAGGTTSVVQGAGGTGAGGGGGGTAPAAGGTAPGAIGGTAPAHWTAALAPDLLGFAQAKGFDKQDPHVVLDSYRNLEKLNGDPASLVKLPKSDDPAEWGAVYDKLGRPKTAAEYSIPLAEGADPKFAEWAKGTFHELGLTAKQGAALAAKWEAQVAGMVKAQTETAAAATAAAVTALKTEWGMAYDQNAKIVDQAAERLGMTGEHLAGLKQAMGPAGAMKFLHGLAVKLGEDKFVAGAGSGAGGFGVMAPAAAQAQIEALKRDPEFVKKYTSNDFDAKKRMEQLHAMAYPTAPAA